MPEAICLENFNSYNPSSLEMVLLKILILSIQCRTYSFPSHKFQYKTSIDTLVKVDDISRVL